MEDLKSTEYAKNGDGNGDFQVQGSTFADAIGEVKHKEAEEQAQQVQIHYERGMEDPYQSQAECSEAESKTEEMRLGKEPQFENENPFVGMSAGHFEGMGKGKEKQIDCETSFSGMSGGHNESSDATMSELRLEGQAGAHIHDQSPSENAIPGPSGMMMPPQASLPQDMNSGFASIIASSVSNPSLEVDSQESDDISDADSAITDFRQSSTKSIQGGQSVTPSPWSKTRTLITTCHEEYVLPNDETEQDRLDLQHQMLLIMLDGKLHLAPINPNLQSCLDVGTGTGIWAIDFAIKYPSASVTGTDLSPIQPEFVPPNCQFEVDDAEDEWMFTRPFDFVHMRGTMTCFRNPREILQRAFDALAPGGYLEMQDSIFPMYCHDDTLEGTSLDKWGKACVEAGVRIGREWTNAPNYEHWMQEIGFEDVKEKKYEVPTSTWPKGRKQKELGMWWQADLLQALGASVTVLSRGLGWETTEAERLLIDVRNDIKNRGVHAYMPIYIVYGRKPKQPEVTDAA